MRWVVSFKNQPLCPLKISPRYSPSRRLCRPPSRSGRFEEEKNQLPGTEPRTFQIKASYYTDRDTQTHGLYKLHIHYKKTHVHRDLSLDSRYVLAIREGLWGSQNNRCCPSSETMELPNCGRGATTATRGIYTWKGTCPDSEVVHCNPLKTKRRLLDF
jgi:hypothetical protein